MDFCCDSGVRSQADLEVLEGRYAQTRRGFGGRRESFQPGDGGTSFGNSGDGSQASEEDVTLTVSVWGA